MQQFSPPMQSYIPPPEFEFVPTQREIDFAQLVASGASPAEAVLAARIVREEDNPDQKALYKMASTLLKSRAVQERLDYYLTLHKHSMAVTADRIRQEGAAIAFSDISEAFREDGTPILNPHEIPRHHRAAIKEFLHDEKGNVKVKYYDKINAMKMVGDMEGLFDEANRAKAPTINIAIGDVGLDALQDSPNPGQTHQAPPLGPPDRHQQLIQPQPTSGDRCDVVIDVEPGEGESGSSLSIEDMLA